jgi:hypothetical protein
MHGSASISSHPAQLEEYHLPANHEGSSGHHTISTVNVGDDRHALRVMGLAIIRRKPGSHVEGEKESMEVGQLGTSKCLKDRPEQATRVHRKNMSKNAWPKYDPTLEKEDDSDDEYYHERIRRIVKAKELYGKDSGGSTSLVSEKRSESSLMFPTMQSLPATCLSLDKEGIKLGDRLAELAITLPPSADLDSSRATSTPSSPDEVVFASRTNTTLLHQLADHDTQRSNSMGVSYSWRSSCAVVGPVRQPDPDRRPPPHTAPGDHEQVVLRGINEKAQNFRSYSRKMSEVKTGFASKLEERFTRLDVSEENT